MHYVPVELFLTIGSGRTQGLRSVTVRLTTKSFLSSHSPKGKVSRIGNRTRHTERLEMQSLSSTIVSYVSYIEWSGAFSRPLCPFVRVQTTRARRNAPNRRFLLEVLSRLIIAYTTRFALRKTQPTLAEVRMAAGYIPISSDRTVIGPLTTVFTPPPLCSAAIIACLNEDCNSGGHQVCRSRPESGCTDSNECHRARPRSAARAVPTIMWMTRIVGRLLQAAHHSLHQLSVDGASTVLEYIARQDIHLPAQQRQAVYRIGTWSTR